MLLARRWAGSYYPLRWVGKLQKNRIIKNLRSFKRTKFTFKVGTPIILHPDGKADHDKRKYFTDQLMYRLAELLPEENRGVYSNLKNISKNEIIEILLGD